MHKYIHIYAIPAWVGRPEGPDPYKTTDTDTYIHAYIYIYMDIHIYTCINTYIYMKFLRGSGEGGRG